MHYLPHGARCSALSVSPKNWKSKTASVATPWRIFYRYYPASGKPVQRVLKGMNRATRLEDRQEITRALLEQELALLRAGLDATTQVMPAPEELGEVSTYTPLMDALTWALARMRIERSTRIDAEHYLGRMRTAAERLGLSMRPLGEVRKKDLRAILREACAQSYAYNKARSYLMSMVEELVDEEAVETNMVRDIKRMKATRRIRETLTMDQRKQVDQHLRENYPTFWRFVHIFFHSGAREIELMRMRREDVDLARHRFKTMVRKGRAATEVWRPIKEIAEPLWREVMAEAQAGDFLFSKGLKPGKNPIRVDQIGKRWRRLVKLQLNISADLYSLKHSNLTELSAMLGQQDAATAAGHKSTQMVAAVYDVEGKSREAERVRKAGNRLA
jgi:site-specific recombinase XerC